MNNLWNTCSANAEQIMKNVKNSYEELMLNKYNVFIGDANTINQLKDSMEKTNIEIDLENNIFIKDDNVENGKIIIVKDKELKRSLLIREGIIK